MQFAILFKVADANKRGLVSWDDFTVFQTLLKREVRRPLSLYQGKCTYWYWVCQYHEQKKGDEQSWNEADDGLHLESILAIV